MAKKTENDLYAIRKDPDGKPFVRNLDDVQVGEDLPKDVLRTFETRGEAEYELRRMPFKP